MSGEEAPRTERRRRGVPLNDLDRSKRYVIAHMGTRWEVIGEFVGSAAEVLPGCPARKAEPVPDAPVALPPVQGHQ